MSNQDIIWNYFITRINNPKGVAGLMGNLYAESGLNPKNLQNTYNKKLNMTDDQYTKAVDNGSYDNFIKDSAGYGLAQWTYWTRKRGLFNKAKNKKSSVGNIYVQLEYLWEELQKYTSVLKVLCNTNSIDEASDIVLTKFEKPANQGDSVKKKRVSYSEKIYKECMKEKKEKKVQITCKSVNIRSGPGSKNPSIAIAYKNDKYPYIETDPETGWHHIKCFEDGKTGWVTGKYTKILEG